jgi:hypothetical protein
MTRPAAFAQFRWLGDKRTQEVHDLDRIQPECDLEDLISSGDFAAFGPDLLAEARNRGYHPHFACRS